jgi:hypothetical protein
MSLNSWYYDGKQPSPVAGQFLIVFFQTLGTPNPFISDFPALYQSPSGPGIDCDIASAYAAGAITLPYTFHFISTNLIGASGNNFTNSFTRESVPNPISHIYAGAIGAGSAFITATVAPVTGFITLVYSS